MSTESDSRVNTAEDQLKRITAVVGSVGYMTPERGRKIYDFITNHRLHDILELGFAHGVSTCYLAGATKALRQTHPAGSPPGRVVSIDLVSSADRKPSAEELIQSLGYEALVTLYREPTSYTWRLMRMLEQDATPRFDLCFIDGAHSWFTDGFAFFLADKLLRPGGWMIFDDLNWTFASSQALKNSPSVNAMPEDEQKTPQVGKVYDLLVKTHADYGEFRVDDGWAYARKSSHSELTPSLIPRIETVYHQSIIGHLFSYVRKRVSSIRKG